ncbi:MAG: hypothetical protein D6690_03885 [Nitrospirae bacterium]|nr:MAG: hypothetical protein D6690_03885 [Nitrospirota bacterium]
MHPIASPLATMRHRTERSKGGVSGNTLLAMSFNPGMNEPRTVLAQDAWIGLSGKVIHGVWAEMGSKCTARPTRAGTLPDEAMH